MKEFTFSKQDLFERVNFFNLAEACEADPKIKERPGIVATYRDADVPMDDDIESISLTFQDGSIKEADVRKAIAKLKTPVNQGTLALAEKPEKLKSSLQIKINDLESRIEALESAISNA